MFHRATGSRRAKRVERPQIDLPTDTIEFRTGDEDELTLTRAARVAPEQRQQRGFRLEDGAVKLEHGEDLFGHTAFTLIIDFCRESAHDQGYLVSFEGSFEMQIERGVLIGSIATDRGTRTLRGALSNAGVGRWHRATLIFCGRSGRLELCLDGKRLSGIGDLAGAQQAGNYFADLCIGHQNGENFTGLLDNFRFLDQPLDRAELPPL